MHDDSIDYQVPLLLIDGEWRTGRAATASVILNPATEERLGEISHASDADLQDVLLAVERGFSVWRATTPAARSAIILAAVALMQTRKESISKALTLEQGKPLAQARGELEVAIEMVKWYGEQARRVYGRIVPSTAAQSDLEIRKEPVGPCLLMSPWNVPVILAARKIAGALAAGCSCIVKPPEETPASVALMIRCFVDAGVPPGVINLVFGVPAHVSARLIASEVIRKISFTGSVSVGQQLAALAAPGLKRLTLELGGHSPVIVYDDIDVESCVNQLVSAKFRNAGQLCHAPTRFYVHHHVYPQFVSKFAERASALRLGNGLLADTDMGPLANKRRLDEIARLVEETTLKGDLVTGGRRVGDRGYFYAPTVLADVAQDARAMIDEPFGPVALFSAFRSHEEVIAKANATRYGLASFVFTDSAAVQRRLMDALNVGSVSINNTSPTVAEAPFGGMKDSGYGYESGEEGLESYLHTKLVHRTYLN